MSVVNNSERTVDGLNNISADIVNINEALTVNGDGGSASQVLRKSATNQLEYGSFALSDIATAGTLIDIDGQTINVRLHWPSNNSIKLVSGSNNTSYTELDFTGTRPYSL